MYEYKHYERALSAEYQITDFNARHYSGRHGVGWLPHAHLLPPFVIFGARGIARLLPTLIPLWLFILLPASMFRDAIIVLRLRGNLRLHGNLDDAHNVFLGSSTVETLSSVENICRLPDTYIHLPWREIPECLPESMTRLDFAKAVSCQDFCWAIWKTWMGSARICIRPGKWHLILYTYMGYRWHLVYRYLIGARPSEIWISNHYDRWALLVDSLSIPCKTMIQHGDLTMKSVEENKVVVFGPTPKLEGTWNLLHFTKGAIDQFLQYVFERPLQSEQKFLMQLELFNPEGEKLPVLVIGSPALQSEQSEEIRQIHERFGNKIKIYYRPHPRAKRKYLPAILDEVDVTLELSRVPKAIAIISYRSTFNLILESVTNSPLISFDYRDELDTFKKRQKLHQILKEALDSVSCAE